MRGIANCKEDVSKKPIDFYSIGHILFGYISFLVSLSICVLLQTINPIEYALVSTQCIAVMWEIFENNILIKTKYKFGKCKDSLENSLFDIIFVFLGGVAGAILCYNGFDNIIIGTVYFVFTSFVAYVVCKRLTLYKKEDNKK